MAQPVLNGVEKPADQIARGPHVFDEATRKYKELPQAFSEFPRAMWHQTLGYKEAGSREQKLQMESEGWSTSPFPAVATAKETTQTQAGDLAMIVLRQAEQMQKMQEQIAALTANSPTTAPVVPVVAPKREPRT
jgi:hypothetical protein